MRPQSYKLQAEFDKVSNILLGEYLIFEVWLSWLDLHIVRTVSTDKVSACEQTISRVHLMRFSLLLEVRVVYAYTPFIGSEIVANAVLPFSMSSTGATGTAVSKNYSLIGTIGGRGWTIFDDDPAASGTWRLIAAVNAARLAMRALVFFPTLLFLQPHLGSLGLPSHTKQGGVQILAVILESFTTLCRDHGPELTGVPVSSSSITVAGEGMGILTRKVSVPESGSDSNTNGRAPS